MFNFFNVCNLFNVGILTLGCIWVIMCRKNSGLIHFIFFTIFVTAVSSTVPSHWSLKAKGCFQKSLNGRLHAKERS